MDFEDALGASSQAPQLSGNGSRSKPTLQIFAVPGVNLSRPLGTLAQMSVGVTPGLWELHTVHAMTKQQLPSNSGNIADGSWRWQTKNQADARLCTSIQSRGCSSFLSRGCCVPHVPHAPHPSSIFAHCRACPYNLSDELEAASLASADTTRNPGVENTGRQDSF